MDIFTYCSYRSSQFGFQYSHFKSDSTDDVSSILPIEKNSQEKIPKEFLKWCYNYSGWQLVLKQYSNQYFLMIGQLEKSRILDKVEQETRGNIYSNMNNLDSDYYMTIGFLGELDIISKVTQVFIQEYLNDGYRGIFNDFESSIKKNKDFTRYIIDTNKFNDIYMDRVNKVSINKTIDITNSKNSFKKKFFLIPDKYNNYYGVERAKIYKEDRTERKSNIKKLIEDFSDINNISNKIPILIAYKDSSIDCNEYKKGIRIDYEYLWEI